MSTAARVRDTEGHFWEHVTRVVALDEAAGVLGQREPRHRVDLARACAAPELCDELHDLYDTAASRQTPPGASKR